MVHKIADDGASVIGLDILLSEPQSPPADLALQQALATKPGTVIVGKVSGFRDGPHWVEPLPPFAQAAIAVGHAHAVLDEDSICRRFPPLELTIDGPRWAFAVEVARKIDQRRAFASSIRTVFPIRRVPPISFPRNPTLYEFRSGAITS